MGLIAIRTSTLQPDVALTFNVYLRISGKHLLYVKRSDPIERARLERLQNKSVGQVFIEETDLPAYEAFLKRQVDAAFDDPALPTESRAEIIVGQARAAVEDIHEDPESKEKYQRAEDAARNQVELLLRHPGAMEQMLKVAESDKTIYQHSVNVATIAIGLAHSLEAPVESCQIIGLGALLHDIGRGGGAPAPDSESYRQHPRVGAGLLVGKKHVHKDVLDVILLHEERLDGQGFPGGIKTMDQLFQVVALANFYDRHVTLEGMSPEEAYDRIASISPAPYEEELIEGLKDVLVANRIY